MAEQLTRIEVFPPHNQQSLQSHTKSALVVGGNVIDTYRSSKRVAAGGNGVNVASALLRLGHQATLITPAPPPEIITAITERGGTIIALRPEEGEGTPRKITYEDDQQVPATRPERDYTIDFQDSYLPPHDVLVLASVDSQSWSEIYDQGSKYAKRTNKFLAILPGNTQIEGAANKPFFESVQRADLICLNRKELVRLLQVRGKETTAEASLLDLILLAAEEFGPDKYISITDKAKSVLYTKDNQVLQINRFGKESSTSIGAGDAYAATLIASLSQQDTTPENALTNAAINAYMTTQEVDAQSGHQTQEQIERIRAANPEYKPVIIYSKTK